MTAKESSKKIAFPLKDILLFLGIIAIIVIIAIVAPYLRYKSFISVSVFYYPISVFLYIKAGLNTAMWLSFSNKGLLLLTVGMGISHFIFLMSKLESRVRSDQLFRLMFSVQLLSASLILLLISAFY